MTILGQIYAVSTLAGSVFITFNFLLGQFGDSTSGGDDCGAASQGSSLGDDAGTASVHDFGTADDGSSAGSGADSGNAGGHDFGASDNSSTSSSNSGYGQHTISAEARGAMGSYAISSVKSLANRSIIAASQDSDFLSRLGFLTLSVLSPMGIAIFLTFFGASGYLILHLFPVLGPLSLIPAILVAVMVSNMFKAAVRWMITHLDSSSLTEVSNLVGQVGEVNTPILKGRTGEITYIVNSKLCSSPAKAANGSLELDRGAKVMIVDTDQQVMLVEPYAD